MVLIASVYAHVDGVLRRSRYRLRRFARWRRRRPVLSLLTIVLVAQVLIITVGAASMAVASTGNLFLSGVEATDVYGVPFAHYETLPLDRGDQWTFHKTFWAALTDLAWALYLAGLGVMLTVFTWVLSFEWLGFILDPVINAIDTVQHFFVGFEWVAFALIVAAAVSGTAVMIGRSAAGWVDLLVSVLCSVVAVGVLVSPVENMRGEDGAVAHMQHFGDEFAQGVVADSDPNVQDKEISDILASQIVTILVRIPAQEITFGGVLEGECKDKYTQVMTDTPPKTGDNSVRDAISGCSEDAKQHVENPSAWQAISAAMIGIGSIGMIVLMGVISVLMFLAVLWAMWGGIRAMFFVYVAILPATGRSALGHAVLSMAAALLSIAVVLMLSVGGLVVVLDSLEQASGNDLSMVVILALMTLLAVFVACLVVYVVMQMRRKSKELGEKFGGVGLGSAKPVQSLNIGRTAMQMLPTAAAANVAKSALKRKPTKQKPQPNPERSSSQTTRSSQTLSGPPPQSSEEFTEVPRRQPGQAPQPNAGLESSGGGRALGGASKPAPELPPAAVPRPNGDGPRGPGRRPRVHQNGNVIAMERGGDGVWRQAAGGPGKNSDGHVIEVDRQGEGRIQRRQDVNKPSFEQQMGRRDSGLKVSRSTNSGGRSASSRAEQVREQLRAAQKR